MTLAALFAILTLLLILGIPIGISLGFATLITMALFSKIPLIMISQNAFAALDSFPLMAIPFFILAGSLMSHGGISRRLLNLADSLVGFITGGLSLVTIVSCMFFSAISGSGPATVSAIGSFMIPAMKEKKYDEGFASALTACAGSIGVIIPPSIPYVIYGVVSGVSVGEMFIAGIIPGILIGLALMVTSYGIAKKNGYIGTREKPELRMALRAIKDSFAALMVPVIILGGIYGGVFTPTEAAVVAVVYAIFAGVFIYKELDFKKFIEALKEAAVINGATTFMVGLSMSFASYLTMERIPSMIAQSLLSITDNKYMLLTMIMGFLLIVGCFIDNLSSMIILTPIFLPIVVSLGVSPLHFGIMMTIALAIGFVTPPYGANLFVASAVSEVSLEKITAKIIPFIIALICCLMLVVFVPNLSLWLVKIFKG